MIESLVVVFPSVFAKKNLLQLKKNIAIILKNQNQKFSKIAIDRDVIIVTLKDPVLGSSAINLLFGIDKIAIAKKTGIRLGEIVTDASKIWEKLILSQDKFYVKIEGKPIGYTASDIQLSITSRLVEKLYKSGAKPGTHRNHTKQLELFISKSNTYICIFTDTSFGGMPLESQKGMTVCGIYDSLSALDCLETIRQGFKVKVIVGYRTESEMIHQTKLLDKILPRMLNNNIIVQYYKIKYPDSATGKLESISKMIDIQIAMAKSYHCDRISAPLNMALPVWFNDDMIEKIHKSKLYAHIPSFGLEGISHAGKFGLEKYISAIQQSFEMKFPSKRIKITYRKTYEKMQKIDIKIGPNNVHDILNIMNAQNKV